MELKHIDIANLSVSPANMRVTDTLDYWAKADERLTREVTIGKTIGAPVNFIVHSIQEMNDQLQRGRPFFIDIVEQGIALYEVDAYPFDRPKPLTPEAARVEAQKYFDEWFFSAIKFKRAAEFLISDDGPKEAAFNLHQATERFYHCVLLVLTLYSPKSHKLNFLRSQAEPLAPELIDIWPRNTKFGQRCFELLRQAYVNARYSPHYKITDEELAWLVERIELLQTAVEAICADRLAPPEP